MSSQSGHFPPGIPDWNNLSVLHRNTLPPRSYFFPFPSEAAALSREITQSDALSLSGTWKFHHAPSPYEAPAGFEAPDFDTAAWSDIQVPGMWQLQGFGRPHYTNTNYHFPVDPPNVPVQGNETGCYVRGFEVPERWRGYQLRLRFEGVDAAFHVYVNGTEAGYHQGSRNPSEFDVSGLVRSGMNRLAVRVYRFCDGSYLEDQDQWRTSGIFRDVFLIGFTQNRIEDVHIRTDLDDKYTDAELKASFRLTGTGKLTVRFLDSNKATLDSQSLDASSDTEVILKVSNPKKWTAETPHLYYLAASFGGQTLTQQIGFRTTSIQNGIFTVNGRRIVFRGANRHEHHPIHGRAVPYDFMKQDLLIMKRHNLNAVRTSHQPSDPRLYELANELGLWVMDEADLECHGFASVAENAFTPEQRSMSYEARKEIAHAEAAKWTSDNPLWEDSYVDRARQLVVRDKNHPCVVMWSLGNEAFYGRNFQAMYDFIRAYDDTRVVHYEGDTHAQTVDVYSQMYPSVNSIVRDFGRAETFDKPLVLCEFIHAMGNGPGNIKEYIDAFYAYPRLQGGFVWEWANHGMVTKNEAGEEYYGYGGDFGEDVHDANFVMDGVLFSDHAPAPGLVEYAKAIEPVQLVEGSTADDVRILNRYDFLTLDHLKAEAKYNVHGGDIVAGEVEIPKDIRPGKSASLHLAALITAAPKDTFAIEISFLHKSQPSWSPLPTHRVAWFQITLSLPTFSPQPSFSSAGIHMTQIGSSLTITASADRKYIFSLATGFLTQITKDDTNVLATPPALTFYRPLTDNDRPQDGWHWLDKRVHQLRARTTDVSWTITDDGAEVVVKSRVAPPVLAWGFVVVTTYSIVNLKGDDEAGLKIGVKAEPHGEHPPATLPRIGLSFSIYPEFDKTEWFGRGSGPSYRDMKLSQAIGYHQLAAKDLWVPFEYPQESGNRTDVSYVDFVSKATSLRAVFEGQTGDFSACYYREKDVDEAQHPWELERKRTQDLNVRLDWAHHGLGTGSCGPKTLVEYALTYGPFEYSLWLI
ncbi:hypothetical protein EJ05DRAFT_25773 [Pseudovirgaria hyperparasitica]|uniref:beta-galactosidase n=1 Tax=Pseudovirgaria hyperparasitica TaxID=470096 RepID=A0A6A6WLL6_9PEZI|nr:uncharacterized protein EJ05DRAFT_25773 [Pseudovirgaria hyperparasitica]KAF2763097.1 hypothetical protein EJ05DRAFT_25773 [Pseudovirgaria hyperparasitica]